MKTVTVPTPPLLASFDGQICVEVVFDAPDGEKYCIRAPIGDGSWFASLVMERVIFPALKRSHADEKGQGTDRSSGGGRSEARGATVPSYAALGE
jgi:hypothetical protein